MTKDNNLKKLTGSTHYNSDAPSLPLRVPEPPKQLTPRELVIWKRTCESLANMKTCTEADYDLVYDYVTLRARKDQLDEQVKAMGVWITMISDRGKEMQRINPMHTEALKIIPILNQMRKELGFSPETRQKLKALESKDSQHVDQDEEFLNNL